MKYDSGLQKYKNKIQQCTAMKNKLINSTIYLLAIRALSILSNITYHSLCHILPL